MNVAANAAFMAAVVARRRAVQEEEEMTTYSTQDLAEGWEFKILRSPSGAFKSPERQAAVLDEERRAGWVLVEKFDDYRLRLKRPAAMRKGDPALEIDPYRTRVGMSESKIMWITVAVTLGVTAAIALIVIGAAALAG